MMMVIVMMLVVVMMMMVVPSCSGKTYLRKMDWYKVALSVPIPNASASFSFL